MAKTVFDVLNEKLTELQGSSEDFLKSGGAKDLLREVGDLSRNYMDDNDD
jgi:hypothetical protein